jgi:GNAT superfamily N-acetyltransferase
MGTAPTVRRAVPDDAESFAACQLACWREAYSSLWGPDRFDELDPAGLVERRRSELLDGSAEHLLAEQDGAVIGIAIAGPSRDDDAPTDLELYAIYVRAGSQNSGVGATLLEEATAGRPVSLWTYRDNARATAFYVSHGFIPDGEERSDFEGILEIRMVRR